MAHIVACRRNQLVLPAVLALLGAPAVHAQTAAGLDSVRVALSGQLDVDTRVVRGPLPGRSGMLLRRAILAVDVTAPGGWALRLQPDFSQGRAGLLDAYVTWSHDALSVRLGRQEPPFGVEKPLSSTTLLFPEYGIISALMIGRLFGVRAGTETPRGTLTIGAYVPAGLQEALIDVERDPEGPPQLGPHGVARVTWRPAPAPADGSAPPRLEFQVAGAYGSYRASDPALSGLPRYLTPAQRPAFAFRSGAGGIAAIALSDGPRRGGSAGAQVVAGALHLIVEGVERTQKVRLGSEPAGDGEHLSHAGWQVRGGWLMGGRRSASFAVLPEGRRGAWEIGARAGGVRFDRDASRYAAPGASARAMTSGGVGLVWVPRTRTRVSASMDVTRLTGITHGTERAAIVRVQQRF